jgi:hypothetical protein
MPRSDHDLVTPGRLADIAATVEEFRTELVGDSGVLTAAQLRALRDVAQMCRSAARVRNQAWGQTTFVAVPSRPQVMTNLN